MRFSTVFQILVVITLLATIACFWVIEVQTLVTAESIVYLTVLSVLVLGLSAFSRSPTYPLLILLCIYVYQKYLLSGLYALFAGFSAISTDLSAFSQYHYSNYLSYAILGLLAAGLALIVGGGGLGAAKGSYAQIQFSDRIVALIIPARMLVYVLILCGISAYLKVLWSLNPELEDSSLNGLRLFLRGTVPRELFVLMIFLMWEKYSRFQKGLVLAGLGVSLLTNMVLESSRAAFYVLAVLFVIVKAAKEGDFLIKSAHARYLAYAAVLSLALFPTITAIRWASYDKGFSIFRDSERVTEQASVFATTPDTLVLALERFVGLNESLRITNDMCVNDPAGSLSLTSNLKRVGNLFLHVGHPFGILPGDAFDVMPSQYLYDHIYKGKVTGFNAQEWGLWEYFYVSTGYWSGLIVVFLCMLVVAFLWRKLAASRSGFQPFLLLISGYFFSSLLVNYDPAYVINSFFIEVVVLFMILPFLTTVAICPRVTLSRG